MNKLNFFLILTILFLSGLILLALQFTGCGGSQDIIMPGKEDYNTFLAWKAEILQKYPTPVEFAKNSLIILKDFTYDDWTLLNYGEWKDASAFQIWQRQLINCVLATNILQELYPGGREVRISQAGPDHVVYEWQGYIISFNGIRGTVYNGWSEYPMPKK